MLSRLLNVRHPTAKQAVITAIDLLGCESMLLGMCQLCFILLSCSSGHFFL